MGPQRRFGTDQVPLVWIPNPAWRSAWIVVHSSYSTPAGSQNTIGLVLCDREDDHRDILRPRWGQCLPHGRMGPQRRFRTDQVPLVCIPNPAWRSAWIVVHSSYSTPAGSQNLVCGSPWVFDPSGVAEHRVGCFIPDSVDHTPHRSPAERSSTHRGTPVLCWGCDVPLVCRYNS